MDVSFMPGALAEAVLRMGLDPDEPVWLVVTARNTTLRHRTARRYTHDGHTREWKVHTSTVRREGTVGLDAQDLVRITRGAPWDEGRLRLRTEGEGQHTLWAEHDQGMSHYRLTALDGRAPEPIVEPIGRPIWTGCTTDLRRALHETTSLDGWRTRMETNRDGLLTIEVGCGRMRMRHTLPGKGNEAPWAGWVRTAEAQRCAAWLDGMETRLWADPATRRAIVGSYSRGLFELEADPAPLRDEAEGQGPAEPGAGVLARTVASGRTGRSATPHTLDAFRRTAAPGREQGRSEVRTHRDARVGMPAGVAGRSSASASRARTTAGRARTVPRPDRGRGAMRDRGEGVGTSLTRCTPRRAAVSR